MYSLSCLSEGQEDKSRPNVFLEIKTNPLTFRFKIKSHEEPYLSSFNERSNWGLWEYDVIEVFIQNRSQVNNYSDKYWEFQLSPLGQQFTLEIYKPRESFATPLDIEWQKTTTIKGNNWEGEFIITDERFKHTEQLYFGAYAILGKKSRQFFSLKPIDNIIDFHRPKLFHHIHSFYQTDQQ